MQEDKQLLLKALCSLLPYNTIVSVAEGEFGFIGHTKKWHKVELTSYLLHQIEEEGAWDFIKPYLRPMSSMTEEEKEEYRNIDNRSYSCPIDYAHIPASDRIDWLNANHFDYRDLIKKGLALEAPKGMYNLNK